LLRVEGSEARHIQKVLRLKKGDKVTIFDGSGREYEGSIAETGSSSVTIEIQNTFSVQRDSLLNLSLAQSLLSQLYLK
jgi:16S rRNA (uracil1498-N3)-methyltransferase